MPDREIWRPQTFNEGAAAWRAHRPAIERAGVHLPDVQCYIPEDARFDWDLAMDAIPALSTDPNSAVPAMLTTMIDGEVFRIVFAPTVAEEVLGEKQRGTWLDETVMFPVVEYTGEVATYGDYNTNGRAGVNTNWPQRQSYRYQIMKEYGELELERAGLAKINWVSEIDKAASWNLQKFLNFSYLYGIQGLENYGLLNDPNLAAALTPSTKSSNVGGTAWMVEATGQPNATANEVFADIQAMFHQLVKQTMGRVTKATPMTLALPPGPAVAFMTTNSFSVNVSDLLKKNIPGLKIVEVPEYGVRSTANPQGIAAGNLAQLIATEVEGQQTGFASFNEKMRGHPIIRAPSSFSQKTSAGTWGVVIRFPAGFVQMLGI